MLNIEGNYKPILATKDAINTYRLDSLPPYLETTINLKLDTSKQMYKRLLPFRSSECKQLLKEKN